ncbi:MFS transporter [Streptomyces sp. NPDC057743]|uniref:MFS transporter n=1 Tax=Streptomyces sp. NPDC057743 TaxID=3346236 RepID=UPI00369BA9C8
MVTFLRRLMPPTGPVRALAVSGFAGTVGHGVILTVSILFFTRSVGLSADRVGLGMTVAAACGVAASILAGRASDAIGPRPTAIALTLVQGLAVACYPLVGGFTGFLVAAGLVMGCHSASEAARGALIASAVGAAERVPARAYLHAVTNAGLAVGTALGGVALHRDTRPVYDTLLLVSGALLVFSGLACLRLPPAARTGRPAGARPWDVLRDRRFALFTVLNTVLVTNDSLITVVLPLWIAQRTHAPIAIYSAILLLNTVVVVCFQVRAGRRVEDVPSGIRALRRSGALLALCCAFFALAAGRAPWMAAAVLVAGAVAHVIGELLYSVGSWALAFELAPEHAHGQYQGVFTMSIQLGGMVAPAAGTALIIGGGTGGWLAFAAVLLAAGLAAPTVTRLAPRTHREPASH